MKKVALIVAGGDGKRMNSDIPKQFLQLNKKPILLHTIKKFSHFDKIILVLPEKKLITGTSFAKSLISMKIIL